MGISKIASRITFCSLALLLGCAKQSADDSNSNPSVSPEADFCSTNYAYGTFVTVDGTAKFSKRGLEVTHNGTHVSRFALAAPISVNLPIRFAEVRVTDAGGSTVQCGKTNSTGQLKATDGVSSLRLPATPGQFLVQVFSRSQHTLAVPVGKIPIQSIVSVKEDIYSNTVYKITAPVVSSGSGTYNVDLVASALENVSAKIEGGAFNIFNDLIASYEYLANNTSTTNLTCLNPKVSVFWKAGFNPNQYVNPNGNPNDTISFYLRTDMELYINGGVLGNVSEVDTDHFDDAVIIHEFGHHVENVCGKMDSPGGSHSGTQRIDPRLAWSEGWGNFFAAHIIKNKLSVINPDLSTSLPGAAEWLYYLDTQGYKHGSYLGYEYIKFNLARPGNSTTETINQSGGAGSYAFDQVSPALHPGESHFREVSVSRGLFKATNACAAPFANCANDSFSDLWKAFDRNSQGMGQSSFPFRNSARLLERFRVVKGSFSGALNTVFTNDEALQLRGDSGYVAGGFTTWVPYGIKLVPSMSACNLKIKPKVNTTLGSDQRYANHFYAIDKADLAAVNTIRLTASMAAGTPGLDVDLIVLKEDYDYNEDCDGSACAKSTSSDIIAANRTSGYPKDLDITGLGPNTNYILNVRVYTPAYVSDSTEYTYTLSNPGGGYLCPSSSY